MREVIHGRIRLVGDRRQVNDGQERGLACLPLETDLVECFAPVEGDDPLQFVSDGGAVSSLR
jgi:hypothetical protein